jgi:hypothetical protein
MSSPTKTILCVQCLPATLVTPYLFERVVASVLCEAISRVISTSSLLRRRFAAPRNDGSFCVAYEMRAAYYSVLSVSPL